MIPHLVKVTRFVLFLCAFAVMSPQPGHAADGKEKICIRAYNIDHTSIPDKNTIIFYMRGSKAWKNTLTAPCYTLKTNTGGFIYSPTNPVSDEICSNLQTIRVRESGETCFLGDFTPFNGKAVPASK